MAAELQSLQAGEERKGSNASQTGDGCLEASWQQITAVCAAVGPSQVDALAKAVSQKVQRKWSNPGADARKRWNSEDEQEQGRTSKQSVLPAPGGFNEGTASGMELDLPRVRVCMAKVEEPEILAQKRSEKGFIQFPKSTFDGRGCTLVRVVIGNGMREPLGKAGSLTALQRAFWSLTFLVFGVHCVNAEEQENHVHQGIVPWTRKRMRYWKTYEWQGVSRGVLS